MWKTLWKSVKPYALVAALTVTEIVSVTVVVSALVAVTVIVAEPSATP